MKKFAKLPVMGIVRGIAVDAVEPLCEAATTAGLTTLEITMNTPGAPALIRRMAHAARGRLMLGAGTVLDVPTMHAALDAGATFIVSPTLVPAVVTYCADNKIPVFPGAFTPQEIYTAWQAGATMVKVFPAKYFGPDYIKEIKGPFNDIKLLACGGVTPENIGAFFAAGASAVAFGASIFRKEWMVPGGYKRIEEALRALLAGYSAA